jgi:hypothetical protein
MLLLSLRQPPLCLTLEAGQALLAEVTGRLLYSLGRLNRSLLCGSGHSARLFKRLLSFVLCCGNSLFSRPLGLQYLAYREAPGRCVDRSHLRTPR